jgi:Trypsin-like peptidase domain
MNSTPADSKAWRIFSRVFERPPSSPSIASMRGTVTRPSPAASPKSAVITVGGGRGFVVMGKRRIGEYYVTDEYVITAAHCLPHLPPCHACSYTEERTYEGLLAPLGGEPAVWAECLFADPVGDIAVLRSPDGQWNPEAMYPYLELMASTTPVQISDAPQAGLGWLLSLDGRWFQGTFEHIGGPLWLKDLTEEIKDGMSGSPIVSATGEAIGVVCVSSEVAGVAELDHGPNPRLFYNLPGWLLREGAQQPQNSKE